METILQLDRVSLHYDEGGERLDVLSRLSLSLSRGECLAVIGPSGCGKSSLLSLIAGHRLPSSGDISFQGRPTENPNPERQLMQQHDSLLPHLTVSENLALASTASYWAGQPMVRRWMHAGWFGLSRIILQPTSVASSISQKTDLALNEVGLTSFGGHFPRSLSGGMRRRAELARCLLAEGSLLLLDEPFSGLDALAREQMHELVERIWIRRGKTCLVVTHDWNEATILADRIMIMSPRPGSFIKEIKVEFPHPRDRSVQKSREFIELADSVHEIIRNERR